MLLAVVITLLIVVAFALLIAGRADALLVATSGH
jgi:hypothetical protein